MDNTALQQLIENLQEKRDMWKADGNLQERRMRGAYIDAIIMAKQLISKEVSQTMKAYDEGYREGYIQGANNQ